MASDEFPPSGLPETARSVPIALLRAREKVMAPIREMLAASGLTEQQWRILRVLAEAGPLDATMLAERAAMLMPSQTRILRTLEAKGLVSRTTDARDRRRQMISITPDGTAIIANNEEQARALAQRVERVVGRDRLDNLFRILAEFDRL